MKRRVAVVLALLFGCSAPDNGSPGPARVVLIGDSITAGMMSGSGGLPYAELLEAELGAGFEVANAGINGSSSLDWRPGSDLRYELDGSLKNVFEYRALPLLPADVATVLLGTNDALGFYEPEPTPGAAYGAALGELVNGLLARGVARVVLMSPPPLDLGGDGAQRRLEEYRREVARLCSARVSVACGPDLLGLLDADVHFSPGPHPNASGSAVIAAALAESIRAVRASVPGP